MRWLAGRVASRETPPAAPAPAPAAASLTADAPCAINTGVFRLQSETSGPALEERDGVLEISILFLPRAVSLWRLHQPVPLRLLLPYRENRRKKQHAVKVKPSQLPHDGSTFTAQIMR